MYIFPLLSNTAPLGHHNFAPNAGIPSPLKPDVTVPATLVFIFDDLINFKTIAEKRVEESL